MTTPNKKPASRPAHVPTKAAAAPIVPATVPPHPTPAHRPAPAAVAVKADAHNHRPRQSPDKTRLTGFGWHPDLPDARDLPYMLRAVKTTLPTSVDLRPLMPAIYNQGDLGSCTANAICGAIQFLRMKEKLPDLNNPSRLFVYYNERAMEGTVSQDAGAQIRDGIKSVAKLGVCDESLWPYKDSALTKKPTSAAYAAALKDLVVKYESVPRTLAAFRNVLASGLPFVFGFTCYDSFESDAVAKSGILPMPAKGESVIGGHAVVCVGYDDTKQMALVRNSWGTDWGLEGYFWMPYNYIAGAKFTSDFWAIDVTK